MSRDSILARLKRSSPPLQPLPQWSPPAATGGADLKQRFADRLQAVGGECHMATNLQQVAAALRSKWSGAAMIASSLPELDIGNVANAGQLTARQLDKLELVVIRGSFAVAENGAVWVNEQAIGGRLLPFITSHLAIVVAADAIVGNMHNAYQRLKGYAQGYGVFIAGPSKTADIEQSLVIGAHGPLSLTVFLIQ